MVVVAWGDGAVRLGLSTAYFWTKRFSKEGKRVANRHSYYYFSFLCVFRRKAAMRMFAKPLLWQRIGLLGFPAGFDLKAAQIFSGLEYIPQKLNGSLVAGGPRSFMLSDWVVTMLHRGRGFVSEAAPSSKDEAMWQRLEARNLMVLQFRPTLHKRACPVDDIFLVALEQCHSKILMIWNSLSGNPISFNLLMLEPYDLHISFILIAQDVVVRCKPLGRNADRCFVSVSLAMCWCSPLFMLGFEMTMSHMQLTQRCKTKCVHSHSDFCFQKWRGWNGAHFPPCLRVHVLGDSCRTLGDRTGLSPCSSLPLATTSDHPSDARSYPNPMGIFLRRRWPVM